MGTTLHTLSPNPGANIKRKRVGRGHGTGRHKTAGKGTKGQKARTGHHGIPKPGFEGGQTMLARRLPKRGFNNFRFQDDVAVINLGDLSERFEQGANIDVDAMKSAGLVPRSAKLVKVLGDGDLEHGFTVQAHYFSASALEKLAAAKGKVVTIAQRPPYPGKAKKAKKVKSAKAPSKTV